jgi:hypothetical protein
MQYLILYCGDSHRSAESQGGKPCSFEHHDGEKSEL